MRQTVNARRPSPLRCCRGTSPTTGAACASAPDPFTLRGAVTRSTRRPPKSTRVHYGTSVGLGRSDDEEFGMKADDLIRKQFAQPRLMFRITPADGYQSTVDDGFEFEAVM